MGVAGDRRARLSAHALHRRILARILAKLMCAAPGKVERAVLFVPSGIKNAPVWHSMSMMGPMIMYLLSRREEGS